MSKYLVLMDPGPVLPALTEVAQAGNTAKNWVNEQMSKGVLEVAYTYPEGGGLAVFNASSPEELQELIHTNPGGAYLRYTVRPVVDFADGIDRMTQVTLAQAAAIASAAAAAATATSKGSG